jgi:hypothetical protein
MKEMTPEQWRRLSNAARALDCNLEDFRLAALTMAKEQLGEIVLQHINKPVRLTIRSGGVFEFESLQ